MNKLDLCELWYLLANRCDQFFDIRYSVVQEFQFSDLGILMHSLQDLSLIFLIWLIKKITFPLISTWLFAMSKNNSSLKHHSLYLILSKNVFEPKMALTPDRLSRK